MQDRQLCAVTLAAASRPGASYLPRLGWVWATAAAAISALLLGLCGRRCAPGGLTEVIPAAFGRAGRAVLASSSSAARCCWEVQRGRCAPSIRRAAAGRLGLLLLLAAAYAAERGEETVLRSRAILFFFLTAVEAVILGFSAVQVRAAWLAPQTGRVPFAAMTVALSPMAVLYVRGRAQKDGRLARGGDRPLCGGGTVRRRYALARVAGGGGVCGLYHGQERVRLRRDGAAGAGRVGRADGGWLLPAFRAVPRQCEDGAGARLEKSAQVSAIFCSAVRAILRARSCRRGCRPSQLPYVGVLCHW